MWRLTAVLASLGMLAAHAALAGPTRSSHLAVAPDGHVFVVNPDQNTVARLEFDGNHVGTLTHEQAVGSCTAASTFDACYPRTVAVGGAFVYVANQNDDSVTRLAQADLGSPLTVGATVLGTGCNPYGVAATPAGDRVLVSCQGTSELLVLDAGLALQHRVALTYRNARAIAVSSDGTTAYVTHYLTEEPTSDAHVSKVDVAGGSVTAVFAIPADTTTCETQNSGQGPLNEISAVALVPDGAPAEVAGQLWVGGEQENNLTKGMFRREPTLASKPGAAMFDFPYAPLPTKDAFNRNVMKASFHDIIRAGIYKLAASDGHLIGKVDIDEGTQTSDIQFSLDGTAAFVVDQGFNSYHVFNTVKGQRANDVTTLFAPPSSYGPGGADPTHACVPDALQSVTNERPFRMAPEAQIVTIDGIDPADVNGQHVDTGVDFDVASFMATGTSRMRKIADGIGTVPMGVGLSPDGRTVYVANFLSRNVVPVTGATASDHSDLRCSNSPNLTQTCGTNNDCTGGGGFCNHPGGASCNVDADCGANGPCVQTAQCVPLLLGPPVSSITGDLTVDPAVDRLPPALLDGKILFDTAARDASVSNSIGLGNAAPPYDLPGLECVNAPGTACRRDRQDCAACSNDPTHLCTSDGDCAGATCIRPSGGEPRLCTNAPTTFCTADTDCGGQPGSCANACRASVALPGAVVSTSHDASYVTCQSCHSDFGGQDGRTWDFSQLGVSLRNTMDLRGRSGFAPGYCDDDPQKSCTFDAACGDGHFCKAYDANIPPNVTGADRARWFNPMLTVHWNGDRDEVEDFEHTFRSLMGAGDCDGAEDTATCQGALVQRSPLSSMDPVDVNGDECAPNRNLPGNFRYCDDNLQQRCTADADCGAGHCKPTNVGVRLTHMADFVYSLTSFVKNPNAADDAAERGRQIFNAQQTQCTVCHVGGPAGKQFFTDKKPLAQLDNSQACGGQDQNNPFLRHDVGTANLFDQTDPFTIAQRDNNFPNSNIPEPGHRGPLTDYLTPTLVDVWNTPPYLHDGTAATLLDVVRPCNALLDDCFQPGRGRNIHQGEGKGLHGVTDMLTPEQLNDLVAFQKTLTTGTPVGGAQTQIAAGTLTLSHVALSFAPKARKGRPPKTGRGVLAVEGALGVPPGLSVDPTAGVTVSLATPSGERMAILPVTFTLKGGHVLRGRASAAGGKVALVLARRTSGYRFVLAGSRLDLSSLDTGNHDLMVAFVIGGTNFVQERNLVAKRNVLRLPPRKKKKKS